MVPQQSPTALILKLNPVLLKLIQLVVIFRSRTLIVVCLLHLLTLLVYLRVMPFIHRPMIWAGVLRRPIILLVLAAVCLVTQPQRVMNGETFTSFYDTEYMWVGNVTEDADGSYSNFNIEVDGERFEISEQRDAGWNRC